MKLTQKKLRLNPKMAGESEERGKKKLRGSNVEDGFLSGVLTLFGVLPFFTAFNLPVYYLFVVFALIGFPFLFSFLLGRFSQGIVAAYVFLFTAAGAAAFYKILWQGYLLLINEVGGGIGFAKGAFFLPFQTIPTEVRDLYGTLAALPIIILLSFFIALWVKKRHLLPAIICSSLLPIAALSFAEGGFERGWYGIVSLAVLGVGWIYLLVLSGISRGERKLSFAAAVFILVFVSLTGLFIPKEEYEESRGILPVRDFMESVIQEFRYETNADMASMPQGNVGAAEDFIPAETPVMEVTMEIPRPMYLRGFTGSAYEEGVWKSLPSSAYGGEYLGIGEWMNFNHFYPQTQLAQAMSQTGDRRRAQVTLKNLALSSQYAYAPYEALTEGDLSPEAVEYQRDEEIFTKGFRGQREFTFNVIPAEAADYGTADLSALTASLGKNNSAVESNQSEEGEADLSGYAETERLYRTFVYNRYLTVPQDVKNSFATFLKEKELEELSGADYKTVTAEIRKFFYENFVFSYQVEKPAEKKDFLDVFLKNKEGYQIHFATLAAMLFREAGVPARYAEGFVITPADISIYTEMDSIVFQLTDGSAHAWVEVYVDGVGWLPVEVTPGFYKVDEDPVSTDGITERPEENPSYFYMKDEQVPTGDENQSPEEEEEEKGLPWLPFLLVLILLFGGAALYVLLRRRALREREKAFSQEDGRKAALAIFRYGVRLLKFDGFSVDTHRPAGVLVEDAQGRYDFSEDLRLDIFANSAYKARFRPGDNALESEELKSMRDYVEFLRDEIAQRQNRLKRIFMKLLWLN